MTYKQKYNIAVNLIKNGYLIHCTDAIFNEFDSSFIKGGSRAKEGYGFYFSDMPYKSIDYGKNFKIIKKDDFNFLDSNTPINIEMFENEFEIKLNQLEDELYNVRNNREYDRLTQEISNIKNNYQIIGGRELFDNIERAIREYGAKTIGMLEYYIPNPDKMIPKLIQLYMLWGYDGYVTDGIYTVFNFKKLNNMVEDIDISKYNLDESLDLSSFEIQDKLNPKFWKNDLLDSRIRLKLLDIADDFTDFLKVDWVKPEDITMTGSLANYNWSEEYSDIDLHIIMDFKKVDKRVDFVREYFQSKKDLWNQKHKDIRILEYPVELYVQDKNEPHSSSGIYSLEKNDWIVKPERKEPTKKNLNQAEKDAEKWMNKIDSLIDRYYPDEIESEKERILKKLDNTFSKIKDSRRQGFSKKNDEMNKNNLTFKMLRRNGYLDKISKKKNEIYDDLMSINENIISTLLKESQESKSQSEAVKYIMNNLGWEHDKAYNFVRDDLRNDMTALRDSKIAKFTLGVTRMFCQGQLNDARTISNLNSTLKLLSAHLNEYDRNLNNLSAHELIDRFAQTRQGNLEQEKNEINSMQFGEQSRYQIVPINSFEEAEQYYQYTNPNSRWCLTHMKNMFDSYTSEGINQIYFCLSEGFQDVQRKVGEGCPLDEYGLSMLSVIVNENGELAYCTTRWNHDNGGSDSAMTAKEISEVVGVNFYNVFKPNNKWNELLQGAMERIGNGESPKDVFDECDNFSEGYAVIILNNKFNWIDTEGNLLFPNRWFDCCGDFNNGYAPVELNNKWTLIDTKGNLLFPNQWFDWCGDFNYGYVVIRTNSKYNWIDAEGKLLSPNQWFDGGGNFYDGYAIVGLNNKWNFIDTEGNLLSPNQWFDDCYSFYNKYAKIKLNGKGENFIDTEGKLLSPNQWFDWCGKFHEGYSKVKIFGKYYWIDAEGELYDEDKNFIRNLRESINGRNIDMIIESTLREYLRK